MKDRTNASAGRKGRVIWPLRWRLLTIVLLLVLLIVPLLIWHDALMRLFASRDQVVAGVRGAGAWGPLVLIGLIVAQTIVAPIPGTIINLAAGYLYGWPLGLLYSWLGLLIGATLAMALARYAGRPLVERLVSRNLLARLDRLASRGGLRFFALAFLIPGLPDDMLCFVAGLTRLPLRVLIPLNACARLPGLFVGTWLGAHAEHAPWQVWAVAGALAALVVVVAWRWGPTIQERLWRRLGDT